MEVVGNKFKVGDIVLFKENDTITHNLIGRKLIGTIINIPGISPLDGLTTIYYRIVSNGKIYLSAKLIKKLDTKFFKRLYGIDEK